MADELSTWEKGLVRGKKSLEEFQEKIGSLTGALDNAASSFSEFGSMITSGITDPTTKAGKALLELSLIEGFDSMAGMDNTRAILTGLGYDAESVKDQMNELLESMKGISGGGDAAALVAGIGASFSTLGEGISTAGPMLEGLNGISSSVVESITNIPDSVKDMGGKSEGRSTITWKCKRRNSPSISKFGLNNTASYFGSVRRDNNIFWTVRTCISQQISRSDKCSDHFIC